MRGARLGDVEVSRSAVPHAVVDDQDLVPRLALAEQCQGLRPGTSVGGNLPEKLDPAGPAGRLLSRQAIGAVPEVQLVRPRPLRAGTGQHEEAVPDAGQIAD